MDNKSLQKDYDKKLDNPILNKTSRDNKLNFF